MKRPLHVKKVNVDVTYVFWRHRKLLLVVENIWNQWNVACVLTEHIATFLNVTAHLNKMSNSLKEKNVLKNVY